MSGITWNWSNQLLLKYGPMDDMHRECVDLCIALANADNETCLDKAEALVLHAVKRFEQENRWMRIFNYPSANAHIKEHYDALEFLSEGCQRIAEGDTEACVRLAEDTLKWFEHHAGCMDIMLAGFLERVGYRGGMLPASPVSALQRMVSCQSIPSGVFIQSAMQVA